MEGQILNSQLFVAILATPSNHRDALGEELASAGLSAVVLQNSEELYRLLAQQSLDAVVLENDLGGFFSGLDIVEKLREHLERPITVLVGTLSEPDRTRAKALKIDHLTDWYAGPVSIRDAIQSARLGVATTAVRIPLDARRAVMDTTFIRPMPQLIVRLAEYLSDEQTSTSALARDISLDPKITADVLRLVNSTAVGARNRITRISDAVSLLGIRRVASLIMSATIERTQSEFDRHLANDLMRWYRGRSVLIACAASAFARFTKNVSRDYVHVLGLMQDMGVLVLAYRFGRRHVHLIDRCRALAPLSLEICEQQELSFTHADVSAALVQKWELPNSMAALVHDHHEKPNPQDVDSIQHTTLNLMRIGEALANMIDVPSPQRNARLQELLRNKLDASAEDLKLCLAEAIAAANELKKLLAVPLPHGKDWDQLLHQIHSELETPSDSMNLSSNDE